MRGRGSAGRCCASQASASCRGASSTMRPSSRKRTRSQTSSGPAGRCSERTTATPRPAASRTSASAASGSSWEVGSSSRSSCGSSASADARQTRCSSPAESSATRRSSRCSAPSAARAARTRGAISTGGAPTFSSAEGDLVLDAAEDHLVLRILEDGGDDACEIGRPRPARVLSAHLHASLEPSAVEMRDEPGQGADERRLARAGGAEDGDDLPGIELERHVAASAGSRPG